MTTLVSMGLISAFWFATNLYVYSPWKSVASKVYCKVCTYESYGTTHNLFDIGSFESLELIVSPAWNISFIVWFSYNSLTNSLLKLLTGRIVFFPLKPFHMHVYYHALILFLFHRQFHGKCNFYFRWLLGYPVIYLFGKECIERAIYNLSTKSLRIYQIFVNRCVQ